jgi:hypothetical protein
MQAMNVGHHNLGSRGYMGKRPEWAKQDAEWLDMGKENPFDQFSDPQERDFIRARYGTHPETGEFFMGPKIRELEQELVIYLLA